VGGRQQPIRRRRPAGLRSAIRSAAYRSGWPITFRYLRRSAPSPGRVAAHCRLPDPGGDARRPPAAAERVVDEDGLLVPEPLVLVVEQVPLLEHVLHLVRDHAVTPVRLVASLRIGSCRSVPSPGVEHDALHLAAQPQVPLRLYRRLCVSSPCAAGPTSCVSRSRPGVGCFIPGLFGESPRRIKNSAGHRRSP